MLSMWFSGWVSKHTGPQFILQGQQQGPRHTETVRHTHTHNLVLIYHQKTKSRPSNFSFEVWERSRMSSWFWFNTKTNVGRLIHVTNTPVGCQGEVSQESCPIALFPWPAPPLPPPPAGHHPWCWWQGSHWAERSQHPGEENQIWDIGEKDSQIHQQRTDCRWS